MRKSFLFLLLTGAFASPMTSQAPQPATTGTLQGKVVRIGTSDPIPSVRIEVTRKGGMGLQEAQMLVGFGGPPPGAAEEVVRRFQEAQVVVSSTRPLQAVSDTSGEFTISNVPAGAYDVRAQREGFFGRSVGGNYPRTLNEAVTVTANEVATIRLSMVPPGSISGRVLDPMGQPLVDAPVHILRGVYTDGVPSGQEFSDFQTTNDLGEYRMFGLAPGSYYVAANPETRVTRPQERTVSTAPRMTTSSGRDMPIATYYSDSTTVARAQSVDLRAGEDRTGVDFRIKTAVGATISGKVINTLPVGVGRSPQATVSLVPHDYTLQRFGGSANILANADTGVFEFSNVTPGVYDLMARAPIAVGWEQNSAPDSATNPWGFGKTVVDVRGENIDNVAVVIGKGTDVRGRLFIDGRQSAAKVRISLNRIDRSLDDSHANNTFVAIALFVPPILEDGSFTIPLVPEGRYRLFLDLRGGTGGPRQIVTGQRGAPNLPTLPQTAYLEDIRLGNVSVYDNGLSVGTEILNPVDVMIRTSVGSVEGLVVNADQKPAAGIAVVLVPPQNRRQNAALHIRATSDAEGRFTLNNVPPGAYTAYAWETVTFGAWQNAEFLARYNGRGTVVNVPAGASATVTVPAIR